jgi:hypothetical protein
LKNREFGEAGAWSLIQQSGAKQINFCKQRNAGGIKIRNVRRSCLNQDALMILSQGHSSSPEVASPEHLHPSSV